jgi:hypothetical protein
VTGCVRERETGVLRELPLKLVQTFPADKVRLFPSVRQAYGRRRRNTSGFVSTSKVHSRGDATGSGAVCAWPNGGVLLGALACETGLPALLPVGWREKVLEGNELVRGTRGMANSLRNTSNASRIAEVPLASDGSQNLRTDSDWDR